MSTATLTGKAVGAIEFGVKAIGDSAEGNGEFEAILSTASLDRDGEIVDAKCFDPLPEWIPIDLDHRLGVRDIVGSGQPFYDGEVLKFRGTFAGTDLGQEVRTLVTEGHIRKMSVFFMNPKRKVVDGVTHVVSAELLNAAIVTIPANRDADITAAKRAMAKAGARNSANDAANLQAIHDLSVENGAWCSADSNGAAAEKSAISAATAYKTVSGSFEERAEQLREAIRQANPDRWGVRVLATFEDNVVYCLDWDEDETYQSTYSFDGTAVTLGSAEPVEITEIVTPSKSLADDPEGKAAAPAAATSPADIALAVLGAQVDELALLV